MADLVREHMRSVVEPEMQSLRKSIETRDARIAELETAVLAAKTLLHPTTDETEEVWQLLDQAYHQHKPKT